MACPPNTTVFLSYTSLVNIFPPHFQFTMSAKRKRSVTQQEIDSFLIASDSKNDKNYDTNDPSVMNNDDKDEWARTSTVVGHDKTQHCV